MNQQIVLVVEDSTDIRLFIKMLLERKGYRVLEATNGRQAIERALEELPHLILMDLSMPVMDGWEATRQLRQLEQTRHVPIVGLSAHCHDEPREVAIRAGCDDCISKPVDDQVLDRILSDFLPGH
jgi:two-component system, cell cycle response regulator DivK